MKNYEERNMAYVLLIVFLGIFLISSTIGLVYKWDNERMIQMGSVDQYPISKEYSFWIDSAAINSSGSQYIIEGWVTKLGKTVTNVNRRVVLIGPDQKVYGMNTVMVKRNSVTQYYNDGNNYDNSGFQAACLINALEQEKSYEVGILLEEDNKWVLVCTGTEIKL